MIGIQFKAISRWGFLVGALALLANCSTSLEFKECETSIDCPSGRVCTVDNYCIIEGIGDPTTIITTNCPAGTYGPQCLPCECVAGSCNDGGAGDGTCSCEAGREGELCDKCSTGFYGENCTLCDCDNGTCEDGIQGTGICNCEDNWAGDACDECDVGSYGSNCTPCACEKGSCDEGLSGDGSCTCSAGWEGTLCDRCAPGFFGPTCQPCDCGDGSCNDGLAGTGYCNCESHFTGPNCDDCAYGWTGENCEVCSSNWTSVDGKCDECAPGKFGPNCLPCDCINGTCDEGVGGNGFCDCDTGWAGASCSQCAPNHYGTTCQACDCVNGACVDGLAGNGQCNCRNQWEGSDCSTCPENWQGGTDCNACAEDWFDGTGPCSGRGDSYEVLIPAGTFMMGSPETELERVDNEQEHSVTLTKAFYIASHELTQAEWKALVGNNPSFGGECDNCPVDGLTWYDALRFANLKSTSRGFTECYTITNCVYEIGEQSICDWDVEWDSSCNGYRLPTEAEWEYAARAGSQTALYNGDLTVPGYNSIDPNLDEIGWYYVNTLASPRTQPVMGLSPNAWGLYDTAGNAREWVWDWYVGEFTSEAQVDPVQSTRPAQVFSPQRIWRGGGWYDNSELCRSAYRGGRAPSSYGFAIYPMGTRLARTAFP